VRSQKNQFSLANHSHSPTPIVAEVFLSYSRSDLKIARKVSRLLWQQGILVEMYNPRALWDDPLREMFQRIPGKDCVVWLSNGHRPTDWILPELERAAQESVPILELRSIGELGVVVKAIKERDWSANISPSFLRDDLPEFDGSLESEKDQMEALFDRQIRAGDGSDYIGRLHWFAREESDENTNRAILFAAILIIPWIVSLLMLLIAGLSLFFWPGAAKWFLLGAITSFLIGICAWNFFKRRLKFVDYRHQAGLW
jgi:hypothetical protein